MKDKYLFAAYAAITCTVVLIASLTSDGLSFDSKEECEQVTKMECSQRYIPYTNNLN